MFLIAYHKVTKKLIIANNDSGLTANDIASSLLAHCEANNLDANDYIAIQHPWNKNLSVILGNHIYNESTKQLEADPNYVSPNTPDPAPTQGTPA